MDKNNNSWCGDENISSAGCRELMNRLQRIDFSIVETVHYLNAYPNSQRALNYYHTLLKKRKTVADAYEEKCGPLTAFGNNSTTSWNWAKGPWPWEADFPGNNQR